MPFSQPHHEGAALQPWGHLWHHTHSQSIPANTCGINHFSPRVWANMFYLAFAWGERSTWPTIAEHFICGSALLILLSACSITETALVWIFLPTSLPAYQIASTWKTKIEKGTCSKLKCPHNKYASIDLNLSLSSSSAASQLHEQKQNLGERYSQAALCSSDTEEKAFPVQHSSTRIAEQLPTQCNCASKGQNVQKY